MIFDPYPPAFGSFLLLSVGKFGKFLTPPSLKNADDLNGWSLTREELLEENVWYWPETAWLIIALLLGYCVTGDTIAKEIPILIN